MAKFRRSRTFFLVCLVLVLLAPTLTRAQSAGAVDQTIAPAVVVRGGLAVKSTAVEVHIPCMTAQRWAAKRLSAHQG